MRPARHGRSVRAYFQGAAAGGSGFLRYRCALRWRALGLDFANGAFDEAAGDGLGAGVLHVVDAHVEEGSEVVELVVGELDDAVEATEGVFEGDAVVGGEVAEGAGGAVDDVHYVLRDVAAEALVEGVVFDGGEIDFGEFTGEIGAEGDEAVEDDDGRHADEIGLFKRPDGGGEVADAIPGEAVQGAEGDGFDDDFHGEVGELGLFGGGGDAVEEGEEAEGFASFVGEGGETDFGIDLVGEAVEVEGALVALRRIVEEFEGTGADAGDHVGIRAGSPATDR